MNSSNDSADIAVEPETPDPPPAEVPVVNELDPAKLTESGTWGETQVIESIKDANFRNRCPDRALRGKATVRFGSGIVTSGPQVGKLILTKQRKRTRIRRFLSYLSS